MARGIRVAALVLTAPLLVLLPVTAAPARAEPTAGPVRAVLRVNQQGWLPREAKQATLMAARAIGPTTFTVTGPGGQVVLRGRVPSRPVGSWSTSFPDVYRIDLSRLRTPGRRLW